MRALGWLSGLAFGLVAACGASSEGGGAPDAGAGGDGAVADAGVPPSVKSAACASTFGSALTAAFGRLDGVVTAIVEPTDQQCAMPNDDHLIVQVRMNGEVYRMVVNVESSIGDPDVRLAVLDLPSTFHITWSEGWHAPVELDYAANLGLHAGQAPFAPHPKDELVRLVADAIPLGAEVSVFGVSSGGAKANSAHEIHWNGAHHDGALVLDPRGASPRVFAFHFADQSF